MFSKAFSYNRSETQFHPSFRIVLKWMLRSFTSHTHNNNNNNNRNDMRMLHIPCLSEALNARTIMLPFSNMIKGTAKSFLSPLRYNEYILLLWKYNASTCNYLTFCLFVSLFQVLIIDFDPPQWAPSQDRKKCC